MAGRRSGSIDAEVSVEENLLIPSTGNVEIKNEIREVEPVHNVYELDEKAARLKFNEEPVTIHLHESTDPNADNVVPVGVNGEMRWLQRGREFTLARKFVERLALARPSSIQTYETRDFDGNRAIGIRKHTALKYPFSVIRDDNPKGVEWLRNLLAQP